MDLSKLFTLSFDEIAEARFGGFKLSRAREARDYLLRASRHELLFALWKCARSPSIDSRVQPSLEDLLEATIRRRFSPG